MYSTTLCYLALAIEGEDALLCTKNKLSHLLSRMELSARRMNQLHLLPFIKFLLFSTKYVTRFSPSLVNFSFLLLLHATSFAPAKK